MSSRLTFESNWQRIPLPPLWDDRRHRARGHGTLCQVRWAPALGNDATMMCPRAASRVSAPISPGTLCAAHPQHRPTAILAVRSSKNRHPTAKILNLAVGPHCQVPAVGRVTRE